MRSWIGRTFVVGLAALALGACGSGDSETGGSTGTSGTTGGTTGSGDATALDSSGSPDSSATTGTGGDDATTTAPEDTVAGDDASGGTEDGAGATGDGTTADDTAEDTDIPSLPLCADKLTACYQGTCCTCFPPKTCEAGRDNSLSGLAQLANGPMETAVEDGDINIVSEFDGDTTGTFTMRMFTAKLAQESVDAKCDIQEDLCKWEVERANFDPDCKPLIVFDNATIVGDKLMAGGPDGIFKLSVPISTFSLALTISRATIEGTVIRGDGGAIIGFSGILAGAIPKVVLTTALENIDNLPFPKETIATLLDTVVKSDVDVLDANGDPGTDGVKESVSVGLVFEAIPADVIGIKAGTPDAGECQEPPTTFSPTSFRLTVLKLGTDGMEGQALDVDGLCGTPDPAIEMCGAP